MSETDELPYDEDDSIKFIKNYLPQELKDRFSDDDIVYILDLVDDFYISNDNEPIEGDEEAEAAFEAKMIEHIIENAKKDKVGDYTFDEIVWILNGELEYCESLDSDEE
jgi:hypothetical protein